MAIYLVEDEVGFDAGLVGFPALGGYMALVLQVKAGLFGSHIPPGHKERVNLFDESYGPTKHIYGSCYWKNRYDGDVLGPKFLQWLTEMRYLAAQLRHQGPLSGFDTASALANISREDATYLEYRRDATNDKSTIHYLKMSQGTTTRVADATTDVRKVHPGRGIITPYLNKVTTAVAPTAGALTEVTAQFGFYSLA
ncbi:MAG: hypothetical protein ACKVG4_03165 [Longimicrobiales bacterium]